LSVLVCSCLFLSVSATRPNCAKECTPPAHPSCDQVYPFRPLATVASRNDNTKETRKRQDRRTGKGLQHNPGAYNPGSPRGRATKSHKPKRAARTRTKATTHKTTNRHTQQLSRTGTRLKCLGRKGKKLLHQRRNLSHCRQGGKDNWQNLCIQCRSASLADAKNGSPDLNFRDP
jgi:hypothetical protein